MKLVLLDLFFVVLGIKLMDSYSYMLHKYFATELYISLVQNGFCLFDLLVGLVFETRSFCIALAV